MPRPLEGVRIADFTHVYAGPFATYFLSLLGAEVIKVETPRGDGMRYYGNDPRYAGFSPFFIAANCGKRSITIDLKDSSGLEVAKRLVASCDVVIENFRPGAMKRLGLGYETAKQLRPDVIYCSVSGYGQTGDKRDYPAIDNIVQATSGMMSINADPDQTAHMTKYTVVDSYTATMAALAIVTALLQRKQDGLSQLIDVAMMDSAMTLMASTAGPFLVTRERPKTAVGRGFSNSPGSGLFVGLDGRRIALGVVQDHQFVAFFNALGREDLGSNPNYKTALGRAERSEELRAEIEAEVARRDVDELEALLVRNDVSAGVVRNLEEAVADPDLRSRGAIQALPIPGFAGGSAEVVGLGFQFEHDGPEIKAPPPYIGQHSAEVLAELGYSRGEVDELLVRGAVTQFEGNPVT